MDCERYERVVVELLYGELDEAGQAAANRHTDQCTRCRRLLAGLRATRSVGTVPVLQVPEGFLQDVVQAERALRSQLPWSQRAGRWLSVLAGYAMRPQLGMAALAMLMVVSGLVLLRTRPGESSGASLAHHVVGEPFAEAEHAVLHAQTATDQSAKYRAELATARQLLAAQGCDGALPSLVRLAHASPRGAEGQAALWEVAQCQQRADELEGAKHSLRQLIAHGAVGTYYDRARAMLDELTTLETPPQAPLMKESQGSAKGTRRAATEPLSQPAVSKIAAVPATLDPAPDPSAATTTLPAGPALPEAYLSRPGEAAELPPASRPAAPGPPEAQTEGSARDASDELRQPSVAPSDLEPSGADDEDRPTAPTDEPEGEAPAPEAPTAPTPAPR